MPKKKSEKKIIKNIIKKLEIHKQKNKKIKFN